MDGLEFGALSCGSYIGLLGESNKLSNRYNIKLVHNLTSVGLWGAYEYKFVEDCMESNGYRLVLWHELPLGTKCHDPDPSAIGLMHGRRQGVASILDE